MLISLIIPTFKRPDEVKDCLDSLCLQKDKYFEVIIADGTPGESLEKYVEPYKDKLNLTFLYEEYLGVSEARNLGNQYAKGAYIIFLDSDCIIPEYYIATVRKTLEIDPYDLFGGPDAAEASFTLLQKAISYSMTSILTTGGIRGKKKHVGNYHPRSFNMGVRKSVYDAVGGFSDFKCGEDIELSIRIQNAGYRIGLIEAAYVYHKRRTSLSQFFKQVYRFGAARINIFMRHRKELKIAHLFPLAFSAGLVLALILLIFIPTIGKYFIGIYALYFLAIFFHSTLENKNIAVGGLSVITTFTQFMGYGWGMLRNAIAVFLLGKKEGIDL